MSGPFGCLTFVWVCYLHNYSSDGCGSPLAPPPNLTRTVSLSSPCSWCDLGLAPVSPHSFQTGDLKVDKVLQTQPPQCWVGGHNYFPQSTDHTPPLSTSYAFWLTGENRALLINVENLSLSQHTSYSDSCFLVVQIHGNFFSLQLQNFAVLIYWTSKGFSWFQSQSLSWSHWTEFLSSGTIFFPDLVSSENILRVQPIS